MASTHEFFVIQAEDRVVGIQEIRMKYDLDSVAARIEQLYAADLVENWVIRVISHVVGRDRRERVALQCKDASFEQDKVLGRQKHCRSWRCSRIANKSPVFMKS